MVLRRQLAAAREEAAREGNALERARAELDATRGALALARAGLLIAIPHLANEHVRRLVLASLAESAAP